MVGPAPVHRHEQPVNFNRQDFDTIYKKCKKQGTVFEDDEFKRSDQIFDLSYVPSLKQADITWKRAHEISNNPVLFSPSKSKKIQQVGILSNPMLINAFLVMRTELVPRIIPSIESEIWPDDYYGVFKFRFWRLNEWVEVVVDDFLPVDVNNKRLFSHVENHFYVRPGLLNQTEIPAPVRTSGMVMYLEQATSVSDIYKCAQKMQDLNNEIIISTNQGDTTDTFIVDLAVGLNARFFKVGGPMRGERTCKLNRLLEIYRQLECTKVQELPETETPASQAVEKLEGLKELKEEEEDGEDATAITTQGKEAEPEGRTGEDEKSCLKSHLNFSFPLIQNPPPPEETEEAESEDKYSGRKGK